MYNITFCLGDPSNDGHGLYKEYHLISNYSAKEIDDAHTTFVNKHEVNLTEYCRDYLDNEISGKLLDYLVEINAINEQDIEEDAFYINDPDEFVYLFFELVKTELPDLIWEYRDLEEDIIYSIYNSGYGLF